MRQFMLTLLVMLLAPDIPAKADGDPKNSLSDISVDQPPINPPTAYFWDMYGGVNNQT